MAPVYLHPSLTSTPAAVIKLQALTGQVVIIRQGRPVLVQPIDKAA